MIGNSSNHRRQDVIGKVESVSCRSESLQDVVGDLQCSPTSSRSAGPFRSELFTRVDGVRSPGEIEVPLEGSRIVEGCEVLFAEEQFRRFSSLATFFST